MLKVTFTESDGKLSLRLEEHAGYAEIGRDIVCASATILAYTVAQYVRDAECNAEIRLESGDAFISCEPSEDTWHEMQNVFLFAKTGYELLAHNYPQYVRLMP